MNWLGDIRKRGEAAHDLNSRRLFGGIPELAKVHDTKKRAKVLASVNTANLARIIEASK